MINGPTVRHYKKITRWNLVVGSWDVHIISIHSSDIQSNVTDEFSTTTNVQGSHHESAVMNIAGIRRNGMQIMSNIITAVL